MSLVRRGNDEICKRYRPKRLSEVIGHEPVVKSLGEALVMGDSRPKAYLFYGERGSGKTTLARILSLALNCDKGDIPEPCLECNNCKMAIEGNAFHITELNMAQLNKKEDADAIVEEMHLTTFTGRNKIYIFDEAQQLTNAAQNLLLKNLEEPPPYTYIFLCTTEPKKLLKTIVSRCEKYELKLPTLKDKKQILRDVFVAEKWTMSKEDGEKVVEALENATFREILIVADQVMRGGLEVLSNIEGNDPETFKICQLLMKSDFNGIVKVIQGMDNVEAEGIRLMVLSYLGKALMTKGYCHEGAKIVDAIEHLTDPFYEARPQPRLLACLFKACCEMDKE